MKKPICAVLCALLVLLSPGLPCFEAAAQFVRKAPAPIETVNSAVGRQEAASLPALEPIGGDVHLWDLVASPPVVPAAVHQGRTAAREVEAAPEVGETFQKTEAGVAAIQEGFAEMTRPDQPAADISASGAAKFDNVQAKGRSGMLGKVAVAASTLWGMGFLALSQARGEGPGAAVQKALPAPAFAPEQWSAGTWALYSALAAGALLGLGLTARLVYRVHASQGRTPTASEVEAYEWASEIVEMDMNFTRTKGHLPGDVLAKSQKELRAKIRGMAQARGFEEDPDETISEAEGTISEFHRRFAAYRHPALARVVGALWP